MRTTTCLMLGVSALAIAGCTNLPEASLGATFGAERFLNGTHGGSGFTGSLASEYTEVARRAAFRDTAWLNATAYITKARQAEAGVIPPLWTPAQIGVNGDATALYDTVVATIAANKDARPAACARLQVMWDQYLEALRGGATWCITPEDARALLDEALAACGIVGPTNFIVYFGFDKTNLTDAARATIAANYEARPAACARTQVMWDQYLEALRGGATWCITPEDARALLDEALALCGIVGPKNFIVYFGFDKTNLTDAARATVDEVVAAVNAMGTTALSLVGHTDTVASGAYNQALSEARARRVSDALSTRGVPAGAMTLAGRSENDLAIATGDNVREPLNRRVEITLSN